SGAAQAAARRRGVRAGLQLPAHADARGADARARMRQDEHPLARARRPLRADGRGGGDGEGAARRDELRSGRHRGACDERDQADAREAPRVSRRLPPERSAGDHGMSVHEPDKTTGIDAEYLSGHRFPYQEDIALVDDIDLLAATPGDDIN